MTLPVVVVTADPAAPPPGVEAARAHVDLRFSAGASELSAALTGADGLFFWRARKADLEAAWPAAASLRWIQAASDGVDGLLFPALIESDVAVTNARGVFDEAIAEWVIGSMLAFATGLDVSVADGTRSTWNDERGTRRLAGDLIVIVGPGPIGRAVAVRARALGMSVAAVGRAARRDALLGDVRGPGDLHATLGRADYVLDALPLTPGTRHLFDAAAFGAMRSSARFLNVGRGATVDEIALVDALRAGRIAGAALDVFEIEPLPGDSPLWTLPGVIVSPHICGDFDGWEDAVVALFVENCGRFARGEVLRNAVDKRAGFGIG